MKKISLSLSLIITCMVAFSQVNQVPFSQWDLSGAETSTVFLDGKEALKMKGIIFLKEVAFLNGTIDVDIHFSELRFFPGLDFRVQNRGNAERFYVRPHQSGNPDANQYTPILNRTAGWQLYAGERYAKAIDYEFDTWHHIRLEVFGDEVKIYFDDMSEPIIYTQLKGNFGAGGFALGAPRDFVHFANFSYEKSDRKSFEEQLEPVTAPEGIVAQWEISDLVHDSLFVDHQIAAKDARGLTWQTVPVESEGLVNFSRYHLRSAGNNTVVARLKIKSETNQIKKISFGASDRVGVYLNGKILYSGIDNFRSRDYRFLGTIGLFDAVYLDLKKGDNEVWFVVQEAFGGWGLQATLEDREGIELR